MQSIESGLGALVSATARAGRIAPVAEPPAPVVWDFDRVLPAPENYPVDFLKRAAVEALDDPGAFTYESFDPTNREKTLGYTGLRDELARWVSARQDVPSLGADSFIVTSGAAQANALAANAFVDPGDGVVVEEWTWPSMIRFLEMRGADVRAAAMDDHGVRVESIEQRLAELRRDGVRPKCLYLIPTFHLPTLTVLALERRRQILELAEEWNLVVIEDDVYAELPAVGVETPRSLLSLDRSGRVIQAKTFSKTLAPTLRMGWMAGDPQLIAALEGARQDIGVSQWLARIAERFIGEGELDRHLARGQEIHDRKRDVICAALEAHCADTLTVTKPTGGLHVWAETKAALPWERAQRRAAENGVHVLSRLPLGADGSPQDAVPGGRTFRLGFAYYPDSELDRGIETLGTSFREVL